MKFIRDQYRTERGGWSRMLAVSCEKCDHFLFYYQKDGPGPLKRCYLDRMIQSEAVVDEHHGTCPACQFPFGAHIIFTKENRPAIRLFAYAIQKKVVRADMV